MMLPNIRMLSLSLLLVFLHSATGQNTAGGQFFVAFPKSTFQNEVLRVFITSHQRDTITFVRVRTLRSYSRLTLVRPGTTRELSPPSSLEILSGLDYNKGIWISPVNPTHEISVTVMKHATANTLSGTYLALPATSYPHVREYEYFITSYFWNNRVSSNYSSTVVLVGCETNTSVVITPSQDVEIPPHFVRASYPRGRLEAGESYPVIIQPMETLHLESFDDLTGTRVVSDKPLTVLGSHECADVPVDVGFCDFLVEQFPPTLAWGRFFLLASPNSRMTGELYKIVGAKASTRARVKCVVEGERSPESGHMTLVLDAPGEAKEFRLGRDRLCSVVSDKPVLLVQYSLGYSLDEVGDPYMLMIPPVKQYSNDYTFASPVSYQNHLTVTVPLEDYNDGEILLNDTTIGGWLPVYCSDAEVCGYATRRSLPPGTHRVRHSGARGSIMAYVYGFEYHDGYGHTAGMTLRQIADVCQHGDLRLVDSSPSSSSSASSDPSSQDRAVSSGAVEMCVEGVWTAVCGSTWSHLEAVVACRQLGYSQYGSVTHLMNSTAPTTWPILSSEVRCQGPEHVLMDCIHSWNETAQCPDAIPAHITCYPRYEVVVEIPGASETPHFHSAHHPATLTCLVSLNTSLHTSQDMHVTWMRGDVVLQNTSQHMVSEMSQVNANGSYGVNTTHFESTLMMHAMETTDDGMYSCLAGVVSSSSGQPLSPLASSSVVMAVVETGSQLFQIRLLGVGRCGYWLLQNHSPLEKIAQVEIAITQWVQSRCQSCGTAHLIADAAFRCFGGAADEITLRGRLHPPSDPASLTGLVGTVREWVRGGPWLEMGGVWVRVDPHCELVIESLEAEECWRTTTSTTSPTTSASTSGSSTSTTSATTSPTTSASTSGSSTSTTSASTSDTSTSTTTTTTSPTTSASTSGPSTSTTNATTSPATSPTTSASTSGSSTSTTTATTSPTNSASTSTSATTSGSTSGSTNTSVSSTSTIDSRLPESGGPAVASSSVVTFVGIGSGVFVATLLVLTLACVATTISCLKYRRTTVTPASHVMSSTSLYDDPVAENLQKDSLALDLPTKYFEESEPDIKL